jgi:hypothetical protein
MPGGYGTDDSTPWGSAGTSYVSPGQTSSPHQPGGGSTNQGGSNALADAINAANAAPPQISASIDLQNQANQAINQENWRRGIGKYANQFGDYDMNQPMATGFGSVFGASSGSTASSKTVQDSLSFMIEDTINQWENDKGGSLSREEHNAAVDAAFSNFYPQIDQMTLEEYLAAGGKEEDYIAAGAGMDPGYANLMGVPEGHIPIEDFYRLPSFDQSWSGMDDFDYGFYDGMPPESASMTDPKWWQQKSLGELNPTGFANLEQMYGEELANKMAAPHAWGIAPFSETIIEGDY